jgi:hypothetical protein
MMRSPSSEGEERSTTLAFMEDPPYSHTGERGQHEETSSGDFSGGGDPESVGSGVLAPSGDGLLSLEGSECAWCLSCLPLIVSEEERR